MEGAFQDPGKETGLGPGTLCCRANTWTHLPSSNKMQRNYIGLNKNNCPNCPYPQLGRFWTQKRQTNQKNRASSCLEQKQGTERWSVRSAATSAHGCRYTDAFLGDHPFSWTPLLCMPFCVHSPLQKLKMKSLPTIGGETGLHSHPGKTLLNSRLKRWANPFDSEATAAADPTVPLAERNICLQPGLTPRARP